MYAVVKAGGRQYKVNEGDKINVSLMDVAVGDEVTLDEVLVLGGGEPVVGKPTVQGASVTAKVAEHGRDPKIIVFKMKRRKGYRRKNGHRQPFTALEITGINYDPTAN